MILWISDTSRTSGNSFMLGIRAEIQRRLQDAKDAPVFLDVERELGTLLTEFTQDKEKEWKRILSCESG